MSAATEQAPARIISTWDELSQLVSRYSEGWIFRGVDDSRYTLTPKVGRPKWRHAGLSSDSREFNIEEERGILEEFKRQARPYVGYQITHDVEWLALAQHHGLPTRLFDWSESPMVAAFFAVESAGTKDDAAIYVWKLSDEIRNEENPFSLNKGKIYRPPHISPRIPAQRGLFTVHSKPTSSISEKAVTKFIIRRDACFRIKEALNSCGINRGSLFPDLDGLAQHLGWLYKWGKIRIR